MSCEDPKFCFSFSFAYSTAVIEIHFGLSLAATLYSSADIVLCAVACCACNEFDSSTADSS